VEALAPAVPWLSRVEKPGGPAKADSSGYQRRRPELTALHQAVREGWPSVKGLVPRRLEEEVRRYLECGRLCYGFVHLECGDCRKATLVALSCKSRGWCPSCTTRRALVAGAELEATLPFVAHRHYPEISFMWSSPSGSE
jgi:hypothetical protein